MNLEQLDGFLAALICGPEIVRPSEYLPVICGDDIVLEDSFGAQPVLQDFLSLIMRHWNVIADTLHRVTCFFRCFSKMMTALLMPTIGRLVSVVEWSFIKNNGLLFC